MLVIAVAAAVPGRIYGSLEMASSGMDFHVESGVTIKG